MVGVVKARLPQEIQAEVEVERHLHGRVFLPPHCLQLWTLSLVMVEMLAQAHLVMILMELMVRQAVPLKFMCRLD